MKVRDIMSSRVASAKPEDSIAHVARMMTDQGISAIPIIEDHLLVGIVTDRDIFQHVELVELSGIEP